MNSSADDRLLVIFLHAAGLERVLVVQRGDGAYSYRRQWRADIRTDHPDSPSLGMVSHRVV